MVADIKPCLFYLFFLFCYRPVSWCWKVRTKPQPFSPKWKTGWVRAWERIWERSEKNRCWEWMNHGFRSPSFFCLFVGWGVDSCPSAVRPEEDMFEETAMERGGRSSGAGAKWIQMSERVHKVEPSCTVVIFLWSGVQLLLSISFFLAVPLSFAPSLLVFIPVLSTQSMWDN